MPPSFFGEAGAAAGTARRSGRYDALDRTEPTVDDRGGRQRAAVGAGDAVIWSIGSWDIAYQDILR